MADEVNENALITQMSDAIDRCAQFAGDCQKRADRLGAEASSRAPVLCLLSHQSLPLSLPWQPQKRMDLHCISLASAIM